MDFSEKLQKEVEDYNAILLKEQEAEMSFNKLRQERMAAFGRVAVTEELLQEQLKDVSIANGHHNTEEGLEKDAPQPK